MQLSWRFALLIGVLLGAVAATTLAALNAMSDLDLALNGVVDIDTPRLLAITHVRRLFRSLGVLERDYMLANSAAERAALDAKAPKLATELSEQLERYASLAPAEDAKLLADIRGARDRFIALSEQVRRAARDDPEAARSMTQLHAKDPVAWEKVIGQLIQSSEQRLDVQAKKTHLLYVQARSTLIWVSLLAAAFGAGLGSAIFLGIRRNVLQVVHMNAHLESLVKARTESLSQRERALRLVMDSTGDGLVEVARDRKLTGACSAAAVRWFGEPGPEQDLAGYLLADDPEQAGSFGMAFDQLAEDVLPWELSRDQMPSRVTRGDRILELDYKRVLEEGVFNKILVIARDVTEAVQTEQLERSTREQHELVTKLLQDKIGFAQFVKDAERLLSELGSERDLTVAKRQLHTLKGNTAMFGLNSMADLCHSIEDRMGESAELPSAQEVASLAALWRLRLSSIESFLTTLGDSHLEIDKTEHDKLVVSLIDRKDSYEIVNMVEVWSWPRTAERLVRLRAHAEHLAKRLEKPLEIKITHNDLRAPRDYLERFWPALIHVVRNAVDHAAEPEAERMAQGKPKATQLELATERTEHNFVVSVRDDGRGVDRAMLLAAARRAHDAVPDDSTLEDLLFMDGVSTRTEVSQTSGRGIGLSAVRQACLAEHGRVEVSSEPGRGTTFRFIFRPPIVKPGALAARLERRWSLLPDSSIPANTQRAAQSGTVAARKSQA